MWLSLWLLIVVTDEVIACQYESNRSDVQACDPSGSVEIVAAFPAN